MMSKKHITVRLGVALCASLLFFGRALTSPQTGKWSNFDENKDGVLTEVELPKQLLITRIKAP